MRLRAFSIAFGACIALTCWGMVQWLGFELLEDRLGALAVPAFAAALLVIAVLAGAAFHWLIGRLPSFVERCRTIDVPHRLQLGFGNKGLAICFAIVFVCWLPWVIFQYPVAMNADTYNQFYQFQTSAPTFYSTQEIYVDAEYVDHHPVFDTLLFGAFLWLGDVLGNQNLGLFAYSLCQSALTALALAASVCFLERLGVPKVLRLAALIFCALFAPLPLFATTMLKDSLFSALFVLFMLHYIQLCQTRGDSLKSRRFIGGFIAVICLCLLTKKTGACIIVPSLVVLAFLYRAQWKRLALAIATPLVVCMGLVPLLVYPAIGGVAPGGSQEALGVLYQQVVTVLREDPSSVTDAERKAIDGVLKTESAIEHYQRDLVDPVKKRAKLDTTLQQRIDFLMAWAAIGMRHPVEYAASVAQVAAPLLAPGKIITCNLTPLQDSAWVERFQNAENGNQMHLGFQKPEPLQSWAESLDGMWRQLGLNPIFAFLFGRGLFGGWLPLLCLLGTCCRDRRRWADYLPVLLTFAVYLLSPASSTRYALHIIYCLPLLFGLLLQATACHAKQDAHHAAT